VPKSETKRSEFRKVLLQRKSGECNDRGQRENEWVNVREVYACATARSSVERSGNRQQDATRWNVELIYVAGLTADDRILWQGRWLEFNGRPFNDGKRCRRLRVAATEVNCDDEELANLEGCSCHATK